MSANELFQDAALYQAIYELERAKLALLLVLDNCTAMSLLPTKDELTKWHSEIYIAGLRLKTAASFCQSSSESLLKARSQNER